MMRFQDVLSDLMEMVVSLRTQFHIALSEI